MDHLVFATHNQDKLKEVQQLIGNHIRLLSLDDIGCNEEIPETATTIQGNAEIKANFVYKHYQYNCFADDTGLEIDALGGEPGVYSARYGGENCSYQDNVNKVLSNLLHVQNRKASFVTCICLIINQQVTFFEGRVKGTITSQPRGEKGFGYDPVFLPDGYKKTYAELTLSEKNKISHRSQAVQQLITFLNHGK
ncbi:MAG: non-canonical purine NTP diphosphatase [Bacteroidetes bacterium]|nr:non-canonical purine NTP diphosphatase [Bacteroidota bacterium]